MKRNAIHALMLVITIVSLLVGATGCIVIPFGPDHHRDDGPDRHHDGGPDRHHDGGDQHFEHDR